MCTSVLMEMGGKDAGKVSKGEQPMVSTSS